jgi:hypothetical protein
VSWRIASGAGPLVVVDALGLLHELVTSAANNKAKTSLAKVRNMMIETLPNRRETEGK